MMTHSLLLFIFGLLENAVSFAKDDDYMHDHEVDDASMLQTRHRSSSRVDSEVGMQMEVDISCMRQNHNCKSKTTATTTTTWTTTSVTITSTSTTMTTTPRFVRRKRTTSTMSTTTTATTTPEFESRKRTMSTTSTTTMTTNTSTTPTSTSTTTTMTITTVVVTTTTTTTTTVTSTTTTTTITTSTTGNCDLPTVDSKICHFWGDPHFTHTFTDFVDRSNCAAPGENCGRTKCCKQPGQLCFKRDGWFSGCRDVEGPKKCVAGQPDLTGPWAPWAKKIPWTCQKVGDHHVGVAGHVGKRGGRKREAAKAFEFHESGVYRVAKQGADFEAQAFFCAGPPMLSLGPTSSVSGLAVKVGDRSVQMIRNPETKGKFRGSEWKRGYWIADSVPASEIVNFYVDGEKTRWHDLGEGVKSTDIVTGDKVPLNARGQQLGDSNMYISQLHSTHEKEAHFSQLPVCLGDTEKNWLIEFSVPEHNATRSLVFESSVTIIASNPDAVGLCGDAHMQDLIKQGPPFGDYGYLDNHVEQYKIHPKDVLFTTKQVHDLCDTCGMPMHGDLCGGVSAIRHSLNGKSSMAFCMHKGYNYAEAAQACKDMPEDWKTVCEVEQCAVEGDVKGLLHVERELEAWFSSEGWNRQAVQHKSIDHCAAENTECKRSKCCKTPGMKCYTTSSYRTAQCFYPGGCDRKKGWECDILNVDLIRR